MSWRSHSESLSGTENFTKSSPLSPVLLFHQHNLLRSRAPSSLPATSRRSLLQQLTHRNRTIDDERTKRGAAQAIAARSPGLGMALYSNVPRPAEPQRRSVRVVSANAGHCMTDVIHFLMGHLSGCQGGAKEPRRDASEGADSEAGYSRHNVPWPGKTTAVERA